MGNFTLKGIRNGAITLLVIVLTLELSPFMLGRFFLHQSFSRAEIRSELKTAMPQADSIEYVTRDDGGYLGDHILHPYLGFVSVPSQGYNNFNLPGIDPITKKASGVANIVIMGGSVAKDIYSHTGNRIKENLQKSDAFKNKEINLVAFALGGYKQPQQLIALNYFMALGAEYDIVINIDGFNEIVLPYADNLPHHVFPSYPRHWNIYSRKKLDSKVMLIMGKQAVIKEQISQSRLVMAGSVFRHSNFALFIWKLKEQNQQAVMADLEIKLRAALDNSEADYQATGIYTSVTDTLAFIREQAAFWMRSSRLVEQLSHPAGFEYFHFLQPNQYDPGSKILNDEERQIACESGPFAYKDAVIMGYPFLREQGLNLKREGVNFIDLSMMFRDESRTLYNDKCCHFNQLGYDLIADRICNEILLQLNQKSK